jgi:hypothetical protein
MTVSIGRQVVLRHTAGRSSRTPSPIADRQIIPPNPTPCKGGRASLALLTHPIWPAFASQWGGKAESYSGKIWNTATKDPWRSRSLRWLTCRPGHCNPHHAHSTTKLEGTQERVERHKVAKLWTTGLRILHHRKATLSPVKAPQETPGDTALCSGGPVGVDTVSPLRGLYGGTQFSAKFTRRGQGGHARQATMRHLCHRAYVMARAEIPSGDGLSLPVSSCSTTLLLEIWHEH